MKRIPLLALCGAALLAAASLVFAAPTAAAVVSSRGPITAIDIQKRSIELRIADGSKLVVKVSSTTKLQRNGKPAKLGRLTLLDRVRVRYETGDSQALGVVANGPTTEQIAGQAARIGFGEGTLTIGGRTIQATAATRISRNGDDASLSEITRDDRLVAHLRHGADDALDLLANGPLNDEVHGTIRSIAANSIVIAPENGTADITLSLDAETQFEIDGVGVSRSAIHAGQAVEAHFHPTSRLAFAVEADSGDLTEDAHLLGTVVSVAVPAGAITVAPQGGGANFTFDVASSTEIEVNGEAAGLDEIAAGMPASVEYDIATLAAKEIKAGNDNTDDLGDEDVHASGTIQAIDIVASTVTLGMGEASASLVLKVTASTEIEIQGESARIGDLVVGTAATVEYFKASLQAKEIKVGVDDSNGGNGGGNGNGGGGNGGGNAGEDAEVSGIVSAIDPGAQTVTFAPPGAGVSVTVTVTSATRIEINGEPGTLADLATGMTGRAEYDLATLEAKEIEVGGSGGGGNSGGGGGGNGGGNGGGGEDAEILGTVSAVNAGASTITIAPQGGGAAVVLEVVGSTKIEIDGEPGTLADIDAGEPVRAEYDVDSLTATEIEVGIDN